MKIALAQVNCHIGNFEGNTQHFRKIIADCKGKADLVVFPELAISGYPPLDFLDYRHFTDECQKMIELIAGDCNDIDVIIGGPSVNPVKEGKNLYNSAFFLSKGKVDSVIHKTLLPTYDVFDEYRYFEPNHTFEIVSSGGKRIALTICEDLWNEEDDPMYRSSPMDHIMRKDPDLIINIAASPFDHTHEVKRKAILQRNVNKYQLPLVYVNHVGAQTDLIFDGGSLVMDENGIIRSELAYFNEEVRIVDIDELASMQLPGSRSLNKTEKIHKALVMGLRDYFRKMNFKTATLGLSGGIDSAVVLAIAAEALGADQVFPVLLPSQYSSDHSITDSIELCNNLGIEPERITIQPLFEQFLETLEQSFADTTPDVTEENIQARIRGTLLMALSNKFGHILLNTSNKSEIAVGYGTLYGDMCGGISVIGDLYKTDVYALARHLNRDNPVIPENIITKAPSAELRPDQKDTDSLPEYDLIDRILYEYIEMQQGYDRILAKGFDNDTVSGVLGMVNRNEYKRYQFAPVLRVSPKCFGFGRRMPLVAKYLN
jgi:NAD+ synthase (glutamine-hydrolysing)